MYVANMQHLYVFCKFHTEIFCKEFKPLIVPDFIINFGKKIIEIRFWLIKDNCFNFCVWVQI